MSRVSGLRCFTVHLSGYAFMRAFPSPRMFEDGFFGKTECRSENVSFRCILASLYEAVSVRPSIGPLVRPSVSPSVRRSVTLL